MGESDIMEVGLIEAAIIGDLTVTLTEEAIDHIGRHTTAPE